MSQQKQKAGKWHYLRSDFQWLPVSSGSHCRVSCSVQKPPCYGWMFWTNKSNYLWAYEHTKQHPKTCNEHCFCQYCVKLEQCHATHPSWPKVMFSLNLELSSFSSWVIWHHFSLQVQKQGVKVRSHWYFSHQAWETIRDHQHNTFNNVKVHS